MAGVQAERVDVVRALKDASKIGVVSFVLFLPLIGLLTQTDINNDLILTTRWPLLFSWVGIIFVGRFVFSLFIAPWLAQRAMRPAAAPPAWRTFIGKWFIRLCHRLLRRLPGDRNCRCGLRRALKWIDNFGILILIYVMLGWGLNIVVGLAGLLDLGYVAFYAVGAYSYALLATNFGFTFWLLLPLAGILACFLGHHARLSGAAPARRLSGHRDAGVR